MTENTETNNRNTLNEKALPLAASLFVVAAMVITLYLLGRVWWCELGDYALYVGEAWNSSHTSQHFFDPYTFTHVLHGVMFFWLAGLFFAGLSIYWRFFIANLAEAAWEVLENTDAVIQKYRENTISLDYFGDSIFNSVGDVLACSLGFFVAYKLGWWRSLGFFLLVEIFLLFWIRDSLLLNIVMLVYPPDFIKNWQMGS